MNLRQIKQLLGSKRIAYREGNKLDEISVCCPKCGDSKFRLQVNPTVHSRGVTGWCFCYKEWQAFPIDRYFGLIHVEVERSDELVVQTSFEQFEQRMRELKLDQEYSEHTKQVNLKDADRFVPIVPATSRAAKKALEYLVKRGFSEDQVKAHQLMFDPTGDFINRVVIPFYAGARLVYFQARDITGHARQKILNPDEALTGVGKSEVLFNYEQAKHHSSVIVCEGWASAMSAGVNAVAINGKHASKLQIKLLRYWSNFVILLDADTETESLRLAGELKTHNTSVRVATLPWGDPNDNPAGAAQAIQKAVEISSVTDAKLMSIQSRLSW